jgi:acetolactate synthase-1/2/3 large subunit
VEQPDDLASALDTSLSSRGPTVIDVVVTRDPAKMLPGVDSRAAQHRQGDRVA